MKRRTKCIVFVNYYFMALMSLCHIDKGQRNQVRESAVMAGILRLHRLVAMIR